MKEFDAYKVVACLDVLIKCAEAGLQLHNVVAAARWELAELNAALEPAPAVPPSAIPAQPEAQPELPLNSEPRRI